MQNQEPLNWRKHIPGHIAIKAQYKLKSRWIEGSGGGGAYLRTLQDLSVILT